MIVDCIKQSSIGQQPSNSSQGVTERSRSIPLVQIITGEQQLSQTMATSNFHQNSNSTGDNLLNFGNSQEFTNDQSTLRNEDDNKPATNYKIINGLGFYFCDVCPFLCLHLEVFLEHKKKDYHSHQSSLTPFLRFKCIGCDKRFYSRTLLRHHLAVDHDCLSDDIEGLMQIVIEANKEETLHMNEGVDQTQNESLVDFNNINDMISTPESIQWSYFNDPQITEQTNFVDNCLNEASDNVGDYQEQELNGHQENNTNNDQNIIEKNISLYKLNTDHINIHKNEEPVLCPDSSQNSPEGFRKNTYLKNRTQPYSCVLCDYTTVVPRLYQLHTQSHKGEKPFKCNDCCFSTTANHVFKLHKMRHSGKVNFQCPLCNYSCIHVTSFRYHAKKYHSEQSDLFDYTSKEQVINGHQENDPNTGQNNVDKSLICTVGSCLVRFKKKSTLKYHVKSHLRDNFQCLVYHCRHFDNNWLSMMMHLWRTHKIDIEMYSCAKCEHKTNSVYKLKAHLKNKHKIENPFLCTVCNRGFDASKKLRKHVRVHSNAQNLGATYLKCLNCSTLFHSKSLLDQHIFNEQTGIYMNKRLDTKQPNETT